MAAGGGALGGPAFRGHWRSLAVFAAACSLALLGIFRPATALPGAALDLGVAAALRGTRGAGESRWSDVVLAPVGLLAFEPAHFVMQREMLRGIKRRTEASVRARPGTGSASPSTGGRP